MKKIIFLFLCLFSCHAFSQGNASCTHVVMGGCPGPDSISYWNSVCQSYSGYSVVLTAGGCPVGAPGAHQSCAKLSSCSCPDGQSLNTVDGLSSCGPPPDGGEGDACPAGQVKDGLGSCNTQCNAPNVLNALSGACEPVVNCIYPQLRNNLANSCADNPDNCAEGAFRDVLTGQCRSYGDTSCPAGFSCADASCLTCTPSGGAASSSGAGASSAYGASSAGAASSAGGNNSSSGNASSASPPPKPPTDPGDNTDPGQSTGGSKPIPAGTSMPACLSQNSQQVCYDYQKCQLTFGVDKCVGITPDQNCPNQYVVNGQKYCVLPSASSGSGSSSGNTVSSGSAGSASSQSGECDPTKKSYDECMGRNKTPNATETSKINSDFNTAANKAIDDYTKLIKEDTEAFTRDGITFKTAPEALKQAVLSHIPQPSTCQPISFTYWNTTKYLNCQSFEKFKLILAWFCSLITLYYIFHLAIKPVQR